MTTSASNGDRSTVRYGDQEVGRPSGGETHQAASGIGPRLTTQQGVPVSDDQNTLRAARDFVTDAVAHCKFIGYTSGAAVLFEAAGLPADPGDMDEGFVSLTEYPAAELLARCRRLRYWGRQQATVA